MYLDRWEGKRRAIRRKAIFWTIVFHLAILAVLWYTAEGSSSDWMPEFLRNMFGNNPDPGRA